MFPWIKFCPKVKIFNWVERFPMELCNSPPKLFSERPNTSRLVQLAKELRKFKPSTSPFPRLFRSKLSLTKLFKLPRFLGIVPVRPFIEKSRI
jgi:hypothetical protein